ncbi:MBL fold metallo-hydrolase [Pseudonocardiaceae bacterium YIM PH 21723]|nr:MBL fold metallo-hydrolase [Pseudonocardiaceae bacterium YIM PH 21723]
MSSAARFRLVGGPTVLIEIGGLRLLTDPTFDGPGEYGRPTVRLVKTAPPAITPAELGPVDVALVSHDEHPDNLDRSGRAFLATVPTVLTTASGAGRLGGGTIGLLPWQTHEVPRPDGGVLAVTAVPAQHGPEGCEPVTGDVIGFVLTGADLPSVYVSGDNAALGPVREIAERFGPLDTAVLFAGAARPGALDGALLTLDGRLAAEAAAILGARRVVPAHLDSWGHFTEGLAEFVEAFTAAGLADRLLLDSGV